VQNRQGIEAVGGNWGRKRLRKGIKKKVDSYKEAKPKHNGGGRTSSTLYMKPVALEESRLRVVRNPKKCTVQGEGGGGSNQSFKGVGVS